MTTGMHSKHSTQWPGHKSCLLLERKETRRDKRRGEKSPSFRIGLNNFFTAESTKCWNQHTVAICALRDTSGQPDNRTFIQHALYTFIHEPSCGQRESGLETALVSVWSICLSGCLVPFHQWNFMTNQNQVTARAGQHNKRFGYKSSNDFDSAVIAVSGAAGGNARSHSYSGYLAENKHSWATVTMTTKTTSSGVSSVECGPKCLLAIESCFSCPRDTRYNCSKLACCLAACLRHNCWHSWESVASTSSDNHKQCSRYISYRYS